MNLHGIFTVLWYITWVWWALCSFAIAVLVHKYLKIDQQPLSHLPGTWYSKWTSLPMVLELAKGTQPKYVHALFEKYGPVVRVGPNQVCFSDLSALKQIYDLQGTFPKSSLYDAFAPGPSVSAAEPRVNERHRHLLEPGLSEESIGQMFAPINLQVGLAIQNMVSQTRQTGAADIYKWWTLMMADIMGYVTFGQSFGLLEEGKKNEIVESLTDGSVLTMLRMTLPLVIPLAEYISLGPATKTILARQKTVQGSKERLARHREAVKENPHHVPPTVFSKLFLAEEEGSLTPEEAISNAVEILANGVDSTASTLTYLIWAVCRRPEVRVQLLEDLDSLPDGFQDEHLEQLDYLNQVIEETLRLYPTVAGSLLRVVSPGAVTTISGHPIPPGTIVSCQAYSMHRDPKIFPNPAVFYPDRWDEPTAEMRDAMLIWGGGTRTCLGSNLARVVLRLATTRFFRAFPHAQISAEMGDTDMEPSMIRFTEPAGQRCLIKCK